VTRGSRQPHRRRRDRRRFAFGPLATLAALTLAFVAVFASVTASSAADGPWTGSGTGATTVAQDNGTSLKVFTYSVGPLATSNGASGNWTFSTTAAAAGTPDLRWSYKGFHAWFQVRVGLTAFVRRGTADVDTVPLATGGPVNCCTAPSGGFVYRGAWPSSLSVQEGDTYGFRMTGSNFDSDDRLQGTLTVRPNLVTNGGFERPSLDTDPLTLYADSDALGGWAIGGHSIDHIRGYWPAHRGQQSIDLDGFGAGSVSQLIPTDHEKEYDVEFFYSANPDVPTEPDPEMNVLWDGEPVNSLPFTHARPTIPSSGNRSAIAMDWTAGRVRVVAASNGSTSSLTFDSADAAESYYGIALDDVSVWEVDLNDEEPVASVITNLTIQGPSIIEGEGPVTINAGAAVVPLKNVPPVALVTPQRSGTEAAPVNQSPVNQSPVNQLPVNQLPVNQSPVNQSPVNQLPVNQSPVNQLGLGPDFRTLAQAPGPLGDTSLSSIPLLREGGWGALLVGTPLAGTPLQSVTLRQLFSLSVLPAALQPEATGPIRFADIDFSNSPLGSLPAMTLALGQLPLSGIPGIDWCALFSGPPVNCTSTTPLPAGTSLLSAALEGAPVNQSPVNQSPVNESLIDALAAAEAPVNQLPVNQLPVNQLPVNQSQILSLPVNQLPVNQSPVNQLSLAAILAANAPVNQSPVNQLPVNQLPVNQTVLDCDGNQCVGTLGAYVDKVLSGKTLGDLRLALAPGDLPDSWTIANLEDFGDMIVGDLLASLPQPNSLTLADVLALALFANNPESFAFETLNIFDTDISLYAEPPTTAAYRVEFTLSPGVGGPPTGSADVDVTVQLPETFAYAPGTSKVFEADGAETCADAESYAADPSLTRVAPGVTEAKWRVAGTIGETYRICFDAAPGIVLGPLAASAEAAPVGGDTVTATPADITVVDGVEALGANNTPDAANPLSNSKLYLSYVTSAADVDYYKVPVPAAGGRTTFRLSHVPADYDLVVYGPGATVLRTGSPTTPPLDGAPLTDTGSELTHVTDALPSQTLDDLRLLDRPIFGVSSSRGTDPEDITVISAGETGFYTVQVTSYNGATSPDPYMLRVTSEAPRAPAETDARTVTGTAATTLVGTLPTGFNTLFIVNRQRLESIHSAADATNVLNAISTNQPGFASLGFPSAVLSVDAAPTVQAAYAAWDASPGSPDLANKVVAAINAVVDTKVRQQSKGTGLKYIVLVGDDRVIPQGRLGDFAVVANESEYAGTFDRSSDLYGTLYASQVLSDDPYGALEPVPYLNRQLHVPRLGVGRLVETPADIVATLNRFTSFSGRLNPSSSLVTGYDFMQDGAAAINAPFAARFGASATTLPSPISTGFADWTRLTLLAAFLPTGGSAPSITSLNGHADHFEFAPPSVSPPYFTTGDLPLGAGSEPAGSIGPLTNRLVFSMGCHSGLSVNDAVVTANIYDWPQAYARNGVGAYLGNTGFGYGDSLVVAYSEQLDALFARRIAGGSTVGNALAGAKQAYFASLGVFGVYDEKAMAEFTLYGLPMWSVTLPGGAPAPASLAPAPAETSADQTRTVQATAVAPTSSAVVTDPSTGLQAEAFVLDGIANTATTTPVGRYWVGPDGVQATHFRPIQPKAYVDVTGANGHGALITELQQHTDLGGINPVYARPIVDSTSTEPELSFGDVAFPARLQALRTYRKDNGTVAQRVVLMTGQFFTGAAPGDDGVGVQRLYTRIGARVLRSPSNDFTPPAFTRIEATRVGATAAFAVDVTDLTETGGAGTVKRVLVALRSGSATTWTFSDLVQTGTSARWTGGIALPSAATPFEYFVQAVDAAGNVGVSTNKGFYFAAVATPASTEGVTVEPETPAPASGWFAGSTDVVANGPAGVTLEVRVDGGAFAPVQPGGGPTITGDGAHVVEARGSNGGAASTVVAIDGSNPAITIVSPSSSGLYTVGSSVPAEFSCADAGSGIASCTGTVASGTPFSTTTIGPQPFAVTAIDNAGQEVTRSVTYNVIWPFTGFFQPVDNPPVINQVNAGAAVPVKFSLGGNRGLTIFAAGSPSSALTNCASGVVVDPIEETSTASTSGLQYSAASNQYTYVWKTLKTYAGTCRTLTVKLADGTTHTATFKFK
jgi:Peptidase family C25